MPTDIMNIDQLVQECGYFTSETTVNSGYGCRHPDQEDIEDEYVGDGAPAPVLATCGRCFTFTCPLGAELNPSDEPEDRAEFERHGMDPNAMSDGEWMLVSTDDYGNIVGAKPDEDEAPTPTGGAS